MYVRTRNDFRTEVNPLGYAIFYREQFLTGAGVNPRNLNYDRHKHSSAYPSDNQLNQQSAEATINACLAGIHGRYLSRCNEIDTKLDIKGEVS